ncbi:MAG: DUF6146 family protein [Bacteroidales bacterium]|jgi:hypothetical protein|nr:DUF6146 family protein [Bacteroidales bacterium]
MKKVIWILLISVFAGGCALFSPVKNTGSAEIKSDAGPDSTEYELVVFDMGFETWLLMQPSMEHSIEYYKAKNTIYVSEWNYRYMSPRRYRGQYESYIDYDPAKNYGLEFERRLFYYFKYFEETNRVSLDPTGR